MKLLLTVEQFSDVFEAYNQAIWSAQIGAYVIGLLVVAALIKCMQFSS